MGHLIPSTSTDWNYHGTLYGVALRNDHELIGTFVFFVLSCITVQRNILQIFLKILNKTSPKKCLWQLWALKLLECWWIASLRVMYISFCNVLKLINDFEIAAWNYIQVLRGRYPIRVRKIVYVIHRLCWINLISETNLASNAVI